MRVCGGNFHILKLKIIKHDKYHSMGIHFSPETTRYLTNVGSMLARRLRRRPNIESTLVKCLVFAGRSSIFFSKNMIKIINIWVHDKTRILS